MPKSGPIIIIEDDVDDQEMLKEVFQELRVPNLLRFFNSCIDPIDYLLTTIGKPFLIISDINLPSMTGIELKQQVNNNAFLRKKSIAFVIFSTTPDSHAIATAYNVWVQGYFVKPSRFSDLKEMMGCILTYWKTSHHSTL